MGGGGGTRYFYPKHSSWYYFISFLCTLLCTLVCVLFVGNNSAITLYCSNERVRAQTSPGYGPMKNALYFETSTGTALVVVAAKTPNLPSVCRTAGAYVSFTVGLKPVSAYRTLASVVCKQTKNANYMYVRHV